MVQGSRAAVAAEGPPRETAKYVGDPGQKRSYRDVRWRRRATARELGVRLQKDFGRVVKWRRVTQCGFCAGQMVEIRIKEGTAYPAGVVTCGSVWVCSVCGAKVRTRRGVEVEAGAAAWTVMHGGQLGMVTLTVRHFQRMPLRQVLEAVASGWRKLQMRKEWRVLRKLLGGTIKGVEVTHGRNGWHVHIHLLLFVEASSAVADVERLVHSLFDPWAELAASVLGVSPDRAHGVHLLWLDAIASKYVSKIGGEITRADMKVGATVNPLTLLDDVERGDFDAMGLFAEYGDAMFGRHALDWSPGLRRRLAMSPEKSDDQVAAEVEDGERVCFVDGRVWNRMCIERDANGLPLVAAYLRKVEAEWLRG